MMVIAVNCLLEGGERQDLVDLKPMMIKVSETDRPAEMMRM